MKILIILIMVMVGCKPKQTLTQPSSSKADTVFVQSVIHITDTIYLAADTVYIPIMLRECEGMKKVNDSLRTKLFVANYKIERVRYYLRICMRNPSQDKFLKGWIKRAID